MQQIRPDANAISDCGDVREMKEESPHSLICYHDEIPEFISRISACAVFERLKGIGMNCGCEYTNLPIFRRTGPYSRYDHSIGVSLIVWHFTKDIRASIAGLLHDISSPSFSHVIDFLNKDYISQESTEASTLDIIRSSPELVGILKDYGFAPEDVCDYHLFPIADNATPRLSADRLEYTLGNALNYGFATAGDVRRLYAGIKVVANEDGIDELAFTDPEAASEFARIALSCSKVYVSDQDRYAMQILSELISNALERGIISRAHLYEPEDRLIPRLCSDDATRKEWEHYVSLSDVSKSAPGTWARNTVASEVTESAPGTWARKIVAKKRYINPLAEGKGRVTAYDAGFNAALTDYLAWSLDYWIEGVFGDKE